MTKSRGILGPRRYWTTEDVAILRARFANEPTAKIAKDLGRSATLVSQKAARLGLHKSEEYLASPAACRLRRGDNVGAAHRFKPGQVPANKGLRRPGWAPGRMAETQFTKGVRRGVAVTLYQAIGSERISKNGYLERKINDDLPAQRRWRAVHIINWEAINGPLPKGHCLCFIDGNKANTAPENLELITRAERMRRNTIHRYPPELKQTIRALGRVKRAIEDRHEKQD